MIRNASAAVQPYEQEHLAALRTLAPECMVLLKKDGTFPITSGPLAAYGSGVRHTIKGGTGSGDVNVRSFLTIEEGLRNAGFSLVNTDWLDAYDALRAAHEQAYRQAHSAEGEGGVLGLIVPEPEYDLPITDSAENAIYVLTRNSGEGADRKNEPGDFLLTDTEIRDIHRAAESHKRFMLVLNTGAPVDLTPVLDVPNILLLSQLGSVTAEALADVLLGKQSPSGRLTATWAVLHDYPSTPGFGDPDDTVYHEGIYVGYRYFDTFRKAPVFPFGYGLSYTKFQVSPESCCQEEGNICVQAAVKNIGGFSCSDVLQLYVSRVGEGLDFPVRELIAFDRSNVLQPGAKETITLRFPISSLSAFDPAARQEKLFAGRYRLLLGDGSGEMQTFADLIIEQDTVLCSLFPLSGLAEESCLHAPKDRPQYPASKQEIVLSTENISLPEKTTVSTDAAIGSILEKLTDKQLAQLCLGDYKEGASLMEIIGNASTIVAGAAGQTCGRLREQGIRPIIMADGPAGLRLSKRYVLRGEDAIALESAFAAENASESANAVSGDETVYYQYCTAIPIGTAIAQSWDTQLAAACGRIVGEEMELFGIDIWLAPALNIQRNPLCGRNFEYYSEDPLISGEMAAGIVSGVEEKPGRMTTIKHLACNNQETNRYFSNSLVSDRAMREIYLKGFAHCIRKAAPSALMTSYNLLNGEHACNRRDLLTQVLRQEWGYEGLVMTDWLVTGGIPTRGAKHPCASAAGCVKAGNDLVMPGMPSDLADILSALQHPDHPYALTREDLMACAYRVLCTLKKLNGKKEEAEHEE